EKHMQRIFDTLASQGSYRTDVVEQMRTRVGSASAREGEALAELERAQGQYGAQIDGVNTTVANIEAQLKLARYYLKIPHWSLPKPVASSISRSAPAWYPASSVGGVAAFLVEADRYPLATYFQENLKFGKNHNTPGFQYSLAGPYDQWPSGMGFDYFY